MRQVLQFHLYTLSQQTRSSTRWLPSAVRLLSGPAHHSATRLRLLKLHSIWISRLSMLSSTASRSATTTTSRSSQWTTASASSSTFSTTPQRFTLSWIAVGQQRAVCIHHTSSESTRTESLLSMLRRTARLQVLHSHSPVTQRAATSHPHLLTLSL